MPLEQTSSNPASKSVGTTEAAALDVQAFIHIVSSPLELFVVQLTPVSSLRHSRNSKAGLFICRENRMAWVMRRYGCTLVDSGVRVDTSRSSHQQFTMATKLS